MAPTCRTLVMTSVTSSRCDPRQGANRTEGWQSGYHGTETGCGVRAQALESRPDMTTIPQSTVQQQRRRAVLASTVGTTIEWYDFFLYGTAAALVFPKLFFPGTSPFAGILL